MKHPECGASRLDRFEAFKAELAMNARVEVLMKMVEGIAWDWDNDHIKADKSRPSTKECV